MIVGYPVWAGAGKVKLKITCWAGYAKPYMADFKKLVKKKHGIDLEFKVHNPVDQDQFYARSRTSGRYRPCPGSLAAFF